MADVPGKVQFNMDELCAEFRERLKAKFAAGLARIRTAISIVEAQLEFDEAMDEVESQPPGWRILTQFKVATMPAFDPLKHRPIPLREDLPLTPERLALLDRIIRRSKRIIKAISELIVDAEAWMALHPDEANEIDIEEDRVMLQWHKESLAQAERINAKAQG